MPKPKLIISSIGTSLLTNQIDRSQASEANWQQQINSTANDSQNLLDQNPKALDILNTLKDRASQILQQGDIKQLRRFSAELNGIYGIYKNQIPQNTKDQHLLISTDTAQGKITAHLIDNLLRSKGIHYVEIPELTGFSAKDSNSFNEGIEAMLTNLHDRLEDCLNTHHIIFNLVGGFKSMQAYLNTIGMFYAHEIVYIFEGTGSELIRIPRLPIKIDNQKINAEKFALMSQGSITDEQVSGIPEALITIIDGDVTLSNWGKLIWNKIKKEKLSAELLFFPYLTYDTSFRNDYKKQKNPVEKMRLQEALATVSFLLAQHQGDLKALKEHSGLKYQVYNNKKTIGHFRVDGGRRVSCIKEDGQLTLRHYGAHDYVNDNP